jgi:hypothetical protein
LVAGLFNRFIRRRYSSSPINVVLWGKADCSLCDKAQAILDRLAGDYNLRVDKRDILADPAALERFRHTIPVVEIENGPRLETKVTELWLRRALDETRSRRE